MQTAFQRSQRHGKHGLQTYDMKYDWPTGTERDGQGDQEPAYSQIERTGIVNQSLNSK